MAEQLIIDYRQANLNAQERLLCDFAIKLTLTPADVDKSDTRRLKENGFTDEQITIATQVISYFNYINRIADGLGVDDEQWMSKISHDDWNRQRGKGYIKTIYRQLG